VASKSSHLSCRSQVSSLVFGTDLVSVIFWLTICVCEQQRVEEVQQECKELQKALRLLTQERDQLQERQRQQNQVLNTHSHIMVASQWSSKDGLHTHSVWAAYNTPEITSSSYPHIKALSCVCMFTFVLQDFLSPSVKRLSVWLTVNLLPQSTLSYQIMAVRVSVCITDLPRKVVWFIHT